MLRAVFKTPRPIYPWKALLRCYNLVPFLANSNDCGESYGQKTSLVYPKNVYQKHLQTEICSIMSLELCKCTVSTVVQL